MWIQYYKDNIDEYSVMMYIPNFLDDFELDMCKYWLNKKYENNYFRGINEYTSYSKHNRKQLWFQQDGEYFCKNWKFKYPRWESNDYDAYITGLQTIVSKKIKNIMTQKIDNEDLYISLDNIKELCKNNIDTSFEFNSSLVNLYENGNECITAHRDSIDSFGIYPTIVGLSIGATRIMRIKKIIFNQDNIRSLKPNNIETQKGMSMDFPLENNSIFIMMGSSQKYYTHEILRETHISEKRFSFTFRKWIG
jgi:alkylated DNA repair dioxygenase AlkB